jgi:hypothetical protein
MRSDELLLRERVAIGRQPQRVALEVAMRKLALALVPLLLLACGQEPAAPTLQAVQPTPAFTFANNPDNGNPRILRFGDVAGFLLIDPQTNLFSLQAGTNRQFGCIDPPELFTFMDVQNILHNPDDPIVGQINEVRLGRGVYIAVYQGFDGWVGSGFDCSDLFSRKLAEGTGNFTNTDNDIFAFLLPEDGKIPRNNYDAFGFVAQGWLTRVDGGTASYNGVSKCVWDGVDLASLKCNDKINF